MELAAYGNPGAYREELFQLKDGMLSVDMGLLANMGHPARSVEDLKSNFEYYADIANWVQRETERAVLYVINTRHKMCPSDNLAYAGGVALNAVINSKILEKTPFRNLYVQPAAGDNGISLGCAFYGWMEVLKKEICLSNHRH
jgi:carbamoyltransferase